MQKLIKINEGHYIVVDDSEIKEDDLVLNPLNEIQTYFKDYNFVESKKITHSTQPLEGVKLLSLSEVEEAINGYSVITLANEHQKIEQETGRTLEGSICSKYGYIAGFKAHQELVKDKLFTIEDMQLAFAKGNDYADKPYPQNVQFENEYKQSLLPKTEWDVTFDEQGKIKLI